MLVKSVTPVVCMKFLMNLKSNFFLGLTWNYASLLILGIGGLTINVFIVTNYNIDALGKFNKIYALYIVLSQFGVAGLHYSSLRYISEHTKNIATSRVIVNSALIVVVIINIFMCAILYFTSGFFNLLFDDMNMDKALEILIPALFLFSINKVFLFSLNGFQLMRLYAVGNMIRVLSMMIYVIICSLYDVNEKYLIYCFFIAEFLLILYHVAIYLFFNYKYLGGLNLVFSNEWISKHLSFGSRSMLGGALQELNTRIDILFVAFFLSDNQVGIYSFAAILAEGFYLIQTVVKNSINPLLTRHIVNKNKEAFYKLKNRIFKYIYPFTFILAIVLIFIYKPILSHIFAEHELHVSWLVFTIYILFYSSVSGFVPFENILSQSNYPFEQSMVSLIRTLTNIILNILLIPTFGLYGAVMGTGFSILIGTVVLVILVRNKLDLKLT